MKKSKLLVFMCVALLFQFKNVTAQAFGERLELDPQLAPFYHGVASGDPLTDRVIIWTRITTDLNQIEGVWRIATDSLFTENLQQGFFYTSAERDYTVKVDVGNLMPNTTYFYDFQSIGRRSLIGRTKTAPSADVDQYRILWTSCSDMNTGYYNVYERMKERNDFDAIYHLGDYIYEYQDDRYLLAGLKVRDVEPDFETITLADYRTRYSFYRLDPKLREIHQQYPWILIWDDHETANDSYKDGALNHQPGVEGSWEDRKNGAVKAYMEWMPIREAADPIDIYRSFKIGDLVEFYALEGRLKAKTRGSAEATLFPGSDDSSRGILGTEQRTWLQNGMLNSTAQWQVIVSPTVFSTLFYTPIFKNGDAWDGYPWERRQIINFAVENNIKNFVVISGDIHFSLALDIPNKIDNIFNTNEYDPQTGIGSMGVNFVGTGTSSVPCCRVGNMATWGPNNPHLKYANWKKNGYVLLDVTPEKVTADYYYVDTVMIESDTSHYWEASWCVLNNESRLTNCGQPSSFNGEQPPFAPSTVGVADTTITSVAQNLGDILGVYPTPAVTFVGVQFFLQDDNDVQFDIYNMQGKLMQSEKVGQLNSGVHYQNIRLNKLSSGEYILNIRNENGQQIATRKIIKQ